jgi:hypothetical protein
VIGRRNLDELRIRPLRTEVTRVGKKRVVGAYDHDSRNLRVGDSCLVDVHIHEAFHRRNERGGIALREQLVAVGLHLTVGEDRNDLLEEASEPQIPFATYTPLRGSSERG